MTNRVYDFTLANVLGATQRLDVSGGFVYVISAPGGNVGVKMDNGAEIALLEGQGFRLLPGQTFSSVTVRNLQAVANAGSIFIGEAGFEDRRISGTVRVIDSSADKTLLGKQYFGSNANGAAPGLVSLVNINANGVSVAIRKIIISSAVAGTFTMGYITSAGTSTPLGSAQQNKNAGGAVSTVKIGASTCAADPPTGAEAPGYVQFVRLSLLANTPLEVKLDNPIILSGTRGLVINGNAVNRDLAGAFDFEEL